MRSKALISVGIVLLALVLVSGACSAGFLAGRYTKSTAQSVPVSTQGPGPDTAVASQTPAVQADLQKLFVPFWEAWNLVHTQFVDQPVNDEALMQGAIRGMLDALKDKHTSYMNPEEYRQANMPLEQEYEGIGAWVDTSQKFLVIISPMPGSPAEKAGLKPGDQVIAVDGEDMTGVDASLTLRKILGPAGTVVRLTIQREGAVDPLNIEIIRAKIPLPSVSGKMLDNHVAYIQISEFAKNTKDELRKNLKNLLEQKPVGLIVDLRYDGGGYLQTAVEVASEFIDKGVVLYEVYGDGKKQTFEASGDGLATQIPLVVLVNEGTASASEIVSGALQDYGRAKLVGTTTYGKGSVQVWTPLPDDQGAIRITVARWLTPKERQINEIGLKPDVEIPLTEDDLKAGRDPQLDKAIEILTKAQ